jgi:hypothetical protein
MRPLPAMKERYCVNTFHWQSQCFCSETGAPILSPSPSEDSNASSIEGVHRNAEAKRGTLKSKAFGINCNVKSAAVN